MKNLLKLISFSLFKTNSNQGQLVSAAIKLLTALTVLVEYMTANGQAINITAAIGFLADFITNWVSKSEYPQE
jgi:hypothetical protein